MTACYKTGFFFAECKIKLISRLWQKKSTRSNACYNRVCQYIQCTYVQFRLVPSELAAADARRRAGNTLPANWWGCWQSSPDVFVAAAVCFAHHLQTGLRNWSKQYLYFVPLSVVGCVSFSMHGLMPDFRQFLPLGLCRHAVSVCNVRVLCRNGEIYGHSCQGMRIGNYIQAFEW